MFSNFLKVAFRSLRTDFRHNALILIGLVVGITSFAVIYRFVDNEYGFDEFHPGAENLYRITTVVGSGENVQRWAITNGHLDPLLEEQVADVEAVARMQLIQSNLVFEVEGRLFSVPEGAGFTTENDIFRVFSGFEFVYGDPATALSEPYQIVLTLSEANKYFGRTDVVGETITWKSGAEEDAVLTVVGVTEDTPPNSHLVYEFLVSGSTEMWERYSQARGGGFPLYVYFRAVDGHDVERLREQISAATGEPYAYITSIDFPIQRVTDIHFEAPNQFEHTAAGNRDFIDVLLAVGILMLLVSSINYVVLGTAKSVHRAREIGIRKALGSSNTSLLMQIVVEAAIMGLVASIISVVAAELTLRRVIASSFGVDLTLFTMPWLIAAVLGIGVGLGIVSVLFLSSRVTRFSVVETLRGKPGSDRAMRFGVRDVLVTSQFVITGTLIIASMVIFRQLDYLRDKDVGFDREVVINVPKAANVDVASFTAYRDALLGESLVEHAGFSLYEFISDYNATSLGVTAPGSNDTSVVRLSWNAVDPEFIPAMGLELVEGRNFEPRADGSETGLIVNEAAREAMGLKNAVGAVVPRSWFAGGEDIEIIGVVRDYHFQGFDRAVAPIVLVQTNENRIQNMLVRVQSGQARVALARLNQVWNEAGINAPFEYAFVDDWFDVLIRKETRLSMLVSIFTLLSILVAALGLVGLISYTAERRRKEIGIRKVVGASVGDILVLINRRYIALLGIALVAAVPLAWWAVQKWLASFAYRVEPGFADVLVPAAMLLGIAVVTISLAATSAAQTNPAVTLRQQ